ncbi:MAG: helix-turn-helix domain-containing protein [Calditrichaeota bacterium]|nr:helix-turn-helix domain-containing protein [Calditrichota bacterium]
MGDKETFNQMFEELKKIREENKITLEQISQETRIRLIYLKYLEEGNLEKLPRVYDRFIFKTYLSKAGVKDPQKYIEEFDKLRQPERKSTTYFSKRPKIDAVLQEKELISKAQLLKLIYIAVPVLFFILLLYFLIDHYSNSPQLADVPVKELTAQKIVSEFNEAESKKQSALVRESGLNILIKASEKCWISYVKDHKDTSDFTLSPNTSVKIKADSVVEFTIGNPAAIVLQVNNKIFENLAKPGQVISYMKLTADGIQKKRIVIPKKQGTTKNDSV